MSSPEPTPRPTTVRAQGHDSRVVVAVITSEPLDSAAMQVALGGPDVGGSVVFTGTVRDSDGGLPVVALSYSAHPAAAGQLAEVAAEVAAAYPAVRLAVAHRTGDLVVGDTAFVVAVSAAHRGQAFEAARVLVDRVKAEVAIWKRQTFADGSQEWVGLPGENARPTD